MKCVKSTYYGLYFSICLIGFLDYTKLKQHIHFKSHNQKCPHSLLCSCLLFGRFKMHKKTENAKYIMHCTLALHHD